MAKTIKEITIMLLVCLITMLLLAIILYRYVPNRKIVPEITTYVATDQVQDLLEDTIDEDSTASDVILTYEVTSADLSNYQKTNDYVPGKANPFAEYTDSIPSTDEPNTSNTTQTNTNSLSDEQTTNTYFKDTGTK